MKSILILMMVLGLCAQAQSVQPLYLKFEGESVNSRLQKMDNLHWNYETNNLDEDIFVFWHIPCDGVALRVATINKRNYIEITHAQVASYSPKTDEEMSAMLASMPYKNGVQLFEDLEREKKLYVVEILPDNKARIYQVRNITRR